MHEYNDAAWEATALIENWNVDYGKILNIFQLTYR